MIKTWFKWDMKRFVFVLIYSFVFLMGVQYTANKSVEAFEWFYKEPGYMLMTLLIVSVVYEGFSKLFNFFTATIIMGVIGYAFGAVNYFKYSMRQEFLTGDDFLTFFEGDLTFTTSDITFSKHLIIFLVIDVLMIVLSFFIDRSLKKKRDFKYKFYMRSIGMLVSILLAGAIVGGIYLTEGIDDFKGETEYIVNKYGLILGFIPSNMPPHSVSDASYTEMFDENYVRDGYEKVEYNYGDAVYNAINEYKLPSYDASVSVAGTNEKAKEAYESGDKTPNIIVIMSESYYDTDHFDNVKSEVDPMAKAHAYQAVYGGGNIEVDIFGGGTANTEIEFLTGIGHKYFSTTLLYNGFDEKNDGQVSIVKYMKEKGYYTCAIHPYKGEFFNRSNVYSYMGFDEKYFRENMKYKDQFDVNISDYSLTKEIIDKFASADAASDDPYFNFCVSVGAHKPCLEYDTGKPYEYDVHFNTLPKSGNFSSVAYKDVKRYFNAIYEQNDAFDELCHYFENVDEPTVILMFGDHAPPFSTDTYADICTSELTDEEKYKTPVVCYNNFGLEPLVVDNVNASYLSSEFLAYLGMELPDACVYNQNLMKYYYKCNNKKVMQDTSGENLDNYNHSEEIENVEEASLNLYLDEINNDDDVQNIWSVQD